MKFFEIYVLTARLRDGAVLSCVLIKALEPQEAEDEPFLLLFLLLEDFFLVLLEDVAHLVLVNKAVPGEPPDDPMFSFRLLLFLLPVCFKFPSYHLFDGWYAQGY